MQASDLFLKNIFIRSAAYEGMQTLGIPKRKLIDHHVAMAKGGVGLTTVSYGAVSADARTFNTQMYINDGSLKELKVLADEVHEAGGKVSMQLTHCGYFSKNKEISKVSEDFAQAAFRLKKIGFDAVEIHMGHGYLLSQFLSPRTNRRKDAYGGSVENRSRFPLEVLEKVIDRVGGNFPVLVKLNLNDGFRGGFSLEDCKYVSRELEKKRCSAIVLSGGFTSKSPFYLMRGKVPLGGMIRNGSSLAEKITMARPLIHDPDFLLKLQSGEIEKTECNRCNKCVVEMDRGGVRCVL